MKSTALLVVAALLLAAVVVADDVENQLEQTERGEVGIQIDKSELHYNSASLSGFQSLIKIDASGETSGDRVMFRMRYLIQGSGKNDATKFKQDFRIRFMEIVEYVEADGATTTDGFNRSDVSKFNYSTKEWNNWAENTPAGASYRQWFLTSKDGVVMINVSITTNSSATLPSGVTIDANTAKFDFAIINFPYTQPSNSFLAVVARVETDDDHEEKEDHDHVEGGKKEGQLQLSQTGSGLTGVFTWQPTVQATVNGQVSSADVIASGFQGDKRSRVAFFAFKANQPSRVEWDPTVSSTSSGNAGFSATINIAILALLVLLAAYLNF